MPVIDNAYPVNENDVAYAPSDMDLNNNMSRLDMNILIDSLCKTRMENPDVVLMDKIKQKPYDPVLQERYELEQDRIAVDDDILKSIFESDTPLTIEERNEYIANGLYDKYQNMIARKANKSPQQMTKEDNDAMSDIEAEIKARNTMAMPGDIEQITEVVSEETVDSFPETRDDITTEHVDTNKSQIFNNTEENSGLDAEDVIDAFKFEREAANKPKNKLNPEQINKIVYGFPSMVAGLTANNDETLSDVTEELASTLEDITSGQQIKELIKDSEPEDDEEKPMSIEEFNDVPATEINVPDDVLTNALLEQYDGVSYQDAAQLISVMNRYKAHEKFNVFEALPNSLKTIILNEASSVGANRSTVNFFAKSFINDLVNNTFLDKEIKDFNEELKEAMAPMGNIVGTMMDEYTDEVYNNFTTNLLAKADEISGENPEKSEQLKTIANNFEQSLDMSRVIGYMAENPGCINRNYKYARDSWRKLVENYNEKINAVSPRPRDLDNCLRGLINAGYPEDYAKTAVAIISISILNAIENGSLEEHVYAYYLSNSLFNLNYTANNSKAVKIVKDALDKIYFIIDEKMAPLKARNTKKNRKRNKKNKK